MASGNGGAGTAGMIPHMQVGHPRVRVSPDAYGTVVAIHRDDDVQCYRQTKQHNPVYDKIEWSRDDHA